MRLCWLDINASYSHASLALPLLHAATPAGADWLRVSGVMSDLPARLAGRVVATAPDVVAATAYLFTHDGVLRTLRRVKALRPACRVVLGGPEFWGGNEEFLRRERGVVDAVFRGEGEGSLARWLERLDLPAQWADVPGLCWLDAAGVYRDNGTAQLSEAEWNALPSPTASSFWDWSKPFVQLETVRGCVNRCAFCTSCLTGAPRVLALERVGERLVEIQQHGIRDVRVLDRTFNADPARAVRLLDLFRELCPDTRFHLEIHPGFLGAEMRAALAAAPLGKLHLEVGLQTTDAAALSACRRGAGGTRAWEGLEFLCSCRNLEVHVDLLAGLPGLTHAALLADLEQVLALGPAEIQLELLKLLPGTPLRDQAASLGVAYAPDPPYEVLATATAGVAELENARNLSTVVDAYYNHPVLQPAVRSAARLVPNVLPDLARFLAAESGEGQGMSLENRCRALHRFLCRAPQFRLAAEQVGFQWLLAGLGPGHGPGQERPWKQPIPAAAALVCGDSAPAGVGHPRVWALDREAGTDFFLYDRGRERSRPVAVYRLAKPAGAR